MVLHGFALDLVALLVPDRDLITADFSDVAFFQVHEAVSNLTQRQLVGRQEVLAKAQTDNQRATTARGHQAVRLLGTDQREAVSAVQALHRRLKGVGQVWNALQGVVDQVDDDFGIGLRSEDIAQALQLFAQLLVVLDDAVVHHGHVIAREVRVGVAFSRRAWVAQRVWAIPSWPANGSSATATSSSLTLPMRRRRCSSPFWVSTAKPALS